jgi:hypothetical protein
MADLPYSTITVSGADAFDFLQAQLASDLARLADGVPNLSAWCNPKGRVISLMRVAKVTEGYALTLPTELIDEVIRRLTMFRFRAKVDFAIQEATKSQLGFEGSVDDWRLENLRAGIADIWQAQTEQFTPHMLNLDLLGAVSVDKGCYPGQEIVARTHFRGKTKRRCLRFESAEPVSPGDKVSDGERDIGEVVNAIGKDLLAVVPIDKADEPLNINGIAVLHLPLPYL